MNSLELLAPALDVSTARAAILAGADAVYIGGPHFSARAEAHNNLQELAELCSFAHQFKVKIHVAVNTLIKDDELPLVHALLESLGPAGADAVIIQDPALLLAHIPQGIEVHASTQCLINTVEKLRFYASLGIRQAVLPRELTLAEIARMHEACPEVTLESFISGALCVSESGNCFISEKLLNRSGNRGRCAQLCRLPMELQKQGKTIASGYLLSMKDNLAADLIPQLVEAGVRSFKIEGRLKPREYVINQVSFLRERLDAFIAGSQGLYQRSSGGLMHINFQPDPHKTFNRGFTHELLLGTNDALVNDKTPKYQGERAAEVIRVIPRGNETQLEVIPYRGIKFNRQDGFTFFNEGKLQGFACNLAEKSFLTVHGRLKLKEHTVLYRNHDENFSKALNARDALTRQVCCELKLKIRRGKLTLLLTNEFNQSAQAELLFDYQPEQGALREDKIQATLSKSFSPYVKTCSVKLEGDCSEVTVPVSLLNSLRKEAFARLQQTVDRVNPDYQFKLPTQLPAYPEKTIDSRLVLNQDCARFYQTCGAELLKPANRHEILMTCRHCLIKTYATCYKLGGSTQGFSLRIGKHEFKLACDCKHCKMLVLHD